MSKKYPVESLLRPPVEYYSAVSYFMIAVLCWLSPSAIMMTTSVAYSIAFALFSLSLYRFYQAERIRRYHMGLRKLKPYSMSSKTLPVSYKKLFLGMGFRWDVRHAQRMADLERKDGRIYKGNSGVYEWARRIEVKLEHNPVFIYFFGGMHEGMKITGLYPRFYKSLSILSYKYKWFPFFETLKYIIDLNPMNPLPDVGGEPSLHGVGMYEGEQEIYQGLGERNGHTLVLGTTRVGKTRLAELLIAQDIRRNDGPVIVFDPKGDGDLFLRMYVEAIIAGREDNFYFFHLGYPEVSARYNPVGSFARITEPATRIANQLPGEGQSAAFREFVWRYVNGISKALVGLGRKVDYMQMLNYGQDIEPLVDDYLKMLAQKNDSSGNWRQQVELIVDSFRDSEQRDFKLTRAQLERDIRVVALMRFCKDNGLMDDVASSIVRTYEYERGYFDKLVSSLLPLMEKLTTGKCAELLSPDYLDPDDSRRIFSWPEIMRTKGIVYVGLDALVDAEVSSAVGNAMFSDLTSYSGHKYKHGSYSGLPDIGLKDVKAYIHADEVNELMGDEFIPMLNKAGGAGYMVTAYTQTWSDIQVRLKDAAKAEQVIGNFNSIIMLRVKSEKTAELITNQLKDVDIDHLMAVSGANDSTDPDSETDFGSKTEQRNTTQRSELIHTYDLMSLPKGQCFALLDGGKPYKIRLPLADSSDFSCVPKNFVSVAEEMKSNYSSTDDWYDFQPSWPTKKVA